MQFPFTRHSVAERGRYDARQTTRLRCSSGRRKLHLAVDADSGEIIAHVMTDRNAGDASQVQPLLDQIDSPIGQFTAEGAYDGKPASDAVINHRADAAVVIPPRPPQRNGCIVIFIRKQNPSKHRIYAPKPRILEATTQQNRGELAINAFEYREPHREGHWTWVLSRGCPVEWFPDGRVARTLGTDTDISALKTIERALNVSLNLRGTSAYQAWNLYRISHAQARPRAIDRLVQTRSPPCRQSRALQGR